MTEQRTLLTAEEFFWQYSSKEGRFSLVKGKVVEAPFLVWVQGATVANIAAELEAFVRQDHLGVVVIGAGFTLERHPDMVYGPNVSFVRKERTPKEGLPQGYFEGAPDLAVEVVSP
jgi:Uma2 family endonuclease